MHILNGNFGVVARGNSLLHCHPQIQIDYEISAIRFIAEIHRNTCCIIWIFADQHSLEYILTNTKKLA